MTRKFGVNSTKYTFTLNVNYAELDKNLGCVPVAKTFNPPKNANPIDSIMNNESNVYTFLDPEKKTKRWMITMIESMKKTVLPENFESPIKCWWCHNAFTNSPLGCPIKHVISPSSTPSSNIGYYLTKGYFCSWNCLLGYGNSIKNIPEFNECIQLIYMMFHENGNTGEIQPAPHFSLLKEYGGPLSIEEYRSTHELYTNTNNHYILMVPVGELYNVKSKF